jgi:hypothetical protein
MRSPNGPADTTFERIFYFVLLSLSITNFFSFSLFFLLIIETRTLSAPGHGGCRKIKNGLPNSIFIAKPQGM